MRWEIEDFVFCDQQQTLTHKKNVIPLEPILVALLAYFCQQNDKILSRDELIEAVWMGRTVTDGAVNRAITKLRKCFGDNPRTPRFIATFPKKGYKFVARVTPIDKKQTARISKPIPQKISRVPYVAGVFVLLLISLLYFWYQPTPQKIQITTTVKPLTSAQGQESHPRVSPNQQFLAYSELNDGVMRLYVKQLSSGIKTEVRPVEDEHAWIGPASWNKKGDKLIYLVTSSEYCRYYLQSFNDMQLGEPELIYECPLSSFGKMAFTHTDDVFIFAERSEPQRPYELYEYTLSTNKKRRINQPPLFQSGNFSFDLHPSKNQLLVSSPTEQLWEAFYSVDLNTDALNLLFELDAYICCGIWDHSGERIVLMGEHPAVQLVSYDLEGQNRQVVFAGSQQLYAPERHPNGKDYVFPVGKGNLDIELFTLSTRQKTNITRSSVDDRLAVMGPLQDKVAYVGLASGTEEVWLAEWPEGEHRKLTQFNDHRHFLDLVFSPDGTMVAGLTLNEIHIVNLQSNAYYKLNIPQTEIRSVSFKDNQTLYYSVKHHDHWRVKTYQLKTSKIQDIDERWQFVRFDKDPANILWLDNNGNLFRGTNKEAVLLTNMENINIMRGAKFNLRHQDGMWFWQEWNTDHYQVFKMDPQGQIRPLVQNDTPYFDVFSDGIIHHTMQSRETDIFQTLKNKLN